MLTRFFTSESVGRGHPDKICDQIADTILDAILAKDENARVAIEVMATNGLIVIGGETNTVAKYNPVDEAWKVLASLGYKRGEFEIILKIGQQSQEIKNGVDQKDGKIGAGDQGLMFGFACDDTPELMPLPIVLAHALAERAEALRSSGKFKWARPDLKTQVTIDNNNGKKHIHTMLMSVQHDANYDQKAFEEFIKKNIMQVVAKEYQLNTDFNVYINPAGSFINGGPAADTGLTGRKLMVDTYGGSSRHGGGAFSGKDYTKVDRSAAYMARYIAKNLVAAKLARVAEIQVAYGISMTDPISLSVNTFGTSQYSEAELTKAITRVFDITPGGIIQTLNLKKTKYAPLACFGHFGRNDIALTWEKTDKVAALQAAIKAV